MKEKVELTYAMIHAALSGDEIAKEQVLEHYEPYIIKLSKVPYVDDEGNVKYRIEEDIYMSLKLKLHEVMLVFKIV